tara:strand:+ start:6614 stop:7912 length:1299 start_codon:yes stop_codon:yes gene_type:complete
MRYIPLTSNFYSNNRANFIDSISRRGIAVFNSNDIYPISADSTMPFEQHRDIFYLTGIDQEETILLLFPDAKNTNYREILFIKKTNNHIKVWEGEKLSKKKASNISGIKTVLWTDDFKKLFKKLLKEAKAIYINTNEHYRANIETQTREDRFIEWSKLNFPNHPLKKSNFILQKLRSIKHNEEISQIKKAIDISEKGFRRVLSFVKPGVWEYEIEAEFSFVFIKNCSKGFAYSPIIASGYNNNTLHYTHNNSKCQSGDLILMDVGAEYGNYSSDITRTIPVSGRFNSRQRAVYDVVLKILEESMQLLTPGTLIKEYNMEVEKLVTSALIDLGLLYKNDSMLMDLKNPAYKKYFMHGISHHLGLDTHDYGLIEEPIQPNMVLTVEPGIYIPEEGFGIRIEDDVVVQKKGIPFNLSKNIPKDPDEIEYLMSVKP